MSIVTKLWRASGFVSDAGKAFPHSVGNRKHQKVRWDGGGPELASPSFFPASAGGNLSVRNGLQWDDCSQSVLGNGPIKAAALNIKFQNVVSGGGSEFAHCKPGADAQRNNNISEILTFIRKFSVFF
ncbi:MAG TPA: hypothetical protein VF503_19560 [Sphingobium sp.]|uniref:hypothetical protein n=1 Tax=Sphingobium sp. TaxID=1912891 RepID=UPI002ED4B41D